MQVLAGVLLPLWLVSGAPSGSTFTVTNTNDSGAGSLRQAILNANGSPGGTITFAIAASGVQTISPASPLPSVASTTIIDGYTQPGTSPNTLPDGDDAVLLIEIDGSNAGPSAKGIVVDANNCTVRGLVVNRFASTGIEIHGDGNTVEGNFVGTNPAGTAALPNGNGGIVLGVFGSHSSNTVGGTTPAARNLVSGNTGPGIQVTATGNVVAGNFVGTDHTGTAALGNTDRAVSVNGTGNTVGGATAASRNILSGNNRGVQFDGSNHVLQSNYVGTDVTGTFAIPNVNEGVNVNSATAIVIGGITGVPGAPPGNVISGNVGNGLDLFADPTGVVVQGNVIGADVSGANPLGNSIDGVAVSGHGNTIGGIASGAGNVIAFNGIVGGFGGNGIEIPNNTVFVGNAIRGNSIFGNVHVGIDLRAPGDATGGVTPNDPLDADVGANQLQNFPIIQAVNHLAPQTATTEVVGKLDSTPSTTFDLDFYTNGVCSNFPRELLQGEMYLGSTQVTTDGGGHASFDAMLPATDPGVRISATATDPSGNTSEFSQRIILAVDVRSGPASGGTAITVSGTDFADPTTLTFGGVASPATFVDDHTLTTTSPALSPGTVNDIVATTPDGTSGTLVMGWVSDFLDVPGNQQFYDYVTTLVSDGITVGVGGGNYGVNQPTLRQQMAVFLLKARHGLCYVPPPCTGTFGDVPCPSTFANWIEALAAEGITGGCGNGNYCPTSPVRRDQMAVFLLKAEHGSSYLPPACTGMFADVPCPSVFADWIEQLAAEQITGGCGGGNYCPTNANTRGQMAVFLTKTFHLQ